MLMNAWMMLVLMKCKCQMQCLVVGCYTHTLLRQRSDLWGHGTMSHSLSMSVDSRVA